MIEVKFFAQLREQLDCAEFQLEDTAVATVEQVRLALVEQRPGWAEPLQKDSLLMAVNHQMVDANARVKQGDEVAFFPPVTGG